eukprot:scaffold29441_cov33-Tisochrysis_lutea.AAC.1
MEVGRCGMENAGLEGVNVAEGANKVPQRTHSCTLGLSPCHATKCARCRIAAPYFCCHLRQQMCHGLRTTSLSRRS